MALEVVEPGKSLASHTDKVVYKLLIIIGVQKYKKIIIKREECQLYG